MTAYDIYPDLGDPETWSRHWHEPVNGQRVLRHVNLKTGEMVDLYNQSGSIFGVVPPARKETVMSNNVPDFRLIESRTEIQGLISEACQASIRAERARIRRELYEAIDDIRQEPAPDDTCIFWIKPSDLLDALDRICPEEE